MKRKLGSHDYTINRCEARDDLGLQIEKPDNKLYGTVKKIHDGISQELELTTPYNLGLLLGAQPMARYELR